MSSIIRAEKPWSVDQFEEYRPDMTAFVRSKVVPLLNQHGSSNVKRLLVHGQVKVGKREIVEYTAVRDSINQFRIHIFISSFHRKADESQRDELDTHGITVFSIHSDRRKKAAITFIGEQLSSNPSMRIVIHWDECDYGTGYKQKLAEMHNLFRDQERIFNIYYSATPEEMLYSRDIVVNKDQEHSLIADFVEEGVVVKYDPPVGYCGAQKFLDNNLVFNALPFFETCGNTIKLSEQGKGIIATSKTELRITNRRIRRLQDDLEDAEDARDKSRIEAITSELKRIAVRNIITLRLPYSLNDDDDDDDEVFSESSSEDVSIKKCKAIYTFLNGSQFVDELKDCIIIADKPDLKDNLPNVKTEEVKWGKRAYWDAITKEKIVIIVNDQTSTRSTEWACHDRVFATHDYRKRLTFNTVAQAQLRPAHYEQNYGGFQPIRIYGHLNTFRFVVGQINASEYLHSEWIVKKIPKSDPHRYRIKNDIDSRRPMPPVRIDIGGTMVTFEGIPDNAGYSNEIAQKILVQLGGTNNGDSKISPRVRGNSKRVPVIFTKFYPCDPAQKHSVLELINNDETLTDVGGIEDGQYFKVSELLDGHHFSGQGMFTHLDHESQMFQGNLRGEYKVRMFSQMRTERHGIRIGRENARLTECYDEGRLGLCLRVATGETEEVSDLEVYKSMYQGL